MKYSAHHLHTDRKRIFGLDILRAMAIILVVLGHGKFILEDTVLEGFPFFKMIDGVDLFFVLSGFLIGGILLRQIESKGSFSVQDLLGFWKRRWFRTLPNYYLVLGLNVLVVRLGIIQEDISQFNWRFLVFVQNFKAPFQGFFWESWSLSIEEWFYLITPVLILIAYRFLRLKSVFLLVTIAMMVLPLMYRISLLDASISVFEWDILFRKTVLCRLDSIGYGLLGAWFCHYYVAFWDKWKWVGLFLGIGLGAFVLINPAEPYWYKQTMYFSLVPLAVLFVLPIAYSIKRGYGRVAKWTVHISKISYSMYLINLALVAEVIRDNFEPHGGIDGMVKYGMYWLVVIVVSSLMYTYFEKPVMDLRDRF